MKNSWMWILGASLIVLLGLFFYKNDKNGLFGISKNYPSPARILQTPRSELANEITLTIDSPKNGDVIQGASVMVSGKTVPYAEVFANDLETKADVSGNFTIVLSLDPGENTISISANDANGGYSEKEIVVTSEQ